MHTNSTKIIVAAIVAVAITAVVVTGCGGGDGGATNVGSVTGYILDVVSDDGIGNMVVTIGGRQGTSDAGLDGFFTVSNVPPGDHDVFVTPTPLFTPVGGSPVDEVPVTANSTYYMGIILVIDPQYDEGELPPL